MKLKAKNRKKLNAIRKALLLGLPISGLMAGECDDSSPFSAQLAGDIEMPRGDRVSARAQDTNRSANENEPAKQNVPVKKTFSIDPMSLWRRRFSTPGIMIPPPLNVQVQKYKVQSGDTWESLAKRHKTTVEIMLRINGVPAETVWKIFDSWLVDQLRRRRDPQSSPKKMDWETIGEGAIPENLKLVPGQEIYVPEKISRE